MIEELPEGRTLAAWPALLALRPAREDPVAFVETVDRVQRPEGYRLLGAVEPDLFGTIGADTALRRPVERPAAAVAGFRIAHNLAWGRFLYVDDLVTHPAARRRGLAGALLDWLAALAADEHCDQMHLDSGVQAERFDAHRLYLNHGYAITCHHFARDSYG